MKLLSSVFKFIISTSLKYKIDDSHGVSHSMKALSFADNIYQEELIKYPFLKEQEKVIYISAAIHDMCDKKYMDERQGIMDIETFLKDKLSCQEVEAVKNIIETMSYSKVKKNGFPDLKNYQMAYHIVREADLLSAYDFDRCMIYDMYTKVNMNMEPNIMDSIQSACNLFEERMFKHQEDKLFLTSYAQREYKELQEETEEQIRFWKKMMLF